LDAYFEYTAKETPQQNSLAETAFTTVSARARALLNAANVPMKERYRLFPEAANTVTKLDWLQGVTIDDVTKTRVEWYGKAIPKFAKHLRTWGEAGTVKSGKDGKLGDRGITMIMVGYANHHDGDVYRMLNLDTYRITETRDVIWLFRMYYEISNSETTKKLPVVSLEVTKASEESEDMGGDEETEAVPPLKSEEREDDESESNHSDGSSSQASNSESWVKHTTRSGRKTGLKSGLYNPETGNTVQFAAVQNYFGLLA
jgi:hypothetical protein